MEPRVSTHVERVAGGEVEHGWVVGQVAGPIGPGSDEAGEIAEGAFAPDVHAALAGIARGKLDDGKCERRVEAEPGSDPDNDGGGPSGRGGGDPAQADACDHIKQEQVAKPESAAGKVWVFGFGDGDPGARQVSFGTGSFGVAQGFVSRWCCRE